MTICQSKPVHSAVSLKNPVFGVMNWSRSICYKILACNWLPALQRPQGAPVSHPTLSFMVNKNVLWSTRAIFGTETLRTASLSLPLLDCFKGNMILCTYLYVYL